MEEKQAQPKTTIAAQATQAAVRNDPVQRYADGADYGTGLKNTDPDRKYVLVYLNEVAMGVEFYEENGYSKEVHREGGPRFFATRDQKVGEPMVFRGHLLMSIGKEEHARLRKFGAHGAGKGSDAWTKMEEALIDRKKRGRNDLIRGISNNELMHVIDESRVTEEKGRI